jgi:hypothetical protein
MQKGMTGQDVLVLQKILNQDTRTEVSRTEVGSKGQETKIFGEKTRDSLKRFQALFIEYTLSADGIFQGNTKDLVNDLCNGTGLFKFNTKQTNVLENLLATDTLATNTLATNTTEAISEEFDFFLDQLPRAIPQKAETIIEKYFTKLFRTIYPPVPAITSSASPTASTTDQSTVPQVTVSSVPF